MAEIKRIKIFQRPSEKKASAFISFRNADNAKRAMLFLRQQPPGFFKEALANSPEDGAGLKNELINIEYPVSETNKLHQALLSVPLEPSKTCGEIVGTLSKKARKLAAAENRIVYIRQVETDSENIRNVLSKFGVIKNLLLLPPRNRYIQQTCDANLGTRFENLGLCDDIESSSDGTVKATYNHKQHHQLQTPSSSPVHTTSLNDFDTSISTPKPAYTAFIVFEKASDAASAILDKAAGCTLPRHKRFINSNFSIDLPMPYPTSSTQIRQYFQNVSEIKQITKDDSSKIIVVEFVTAVGAAKAIVHCRTNKFENFFIIEADYSPSIRPEDIGVVNDLDKDCSDTKLNPTCDEIRKVKSSDEVLQWQRSDEVRQWQRADDVKYWQRSDEVLERSDDNHKWDEVKQWDRLDVKHKWETCSSLRSDEFKQHKWESLAESSVYLNYRRDNL